MLTTALVLAVLAADPGQDVDLSQGMKANLMQVASIYPYLQKPGAFRDPANAKAIRVSLDVLRNIRHVTSARDNEAIATVASLFEQEAATAVAEFDAGEKDAARHRAIGLTRMCVACHARTTSDADWSGAEGLVASLKLTPLERANFYVGTHQLDRAKEIWAHAFMVTPASDSEDFEQAEGLRLAVATLTRANEPDAVLALLGPARARRDFPGFFQRNIHRWYADAMAWRGEKYEPDGMSPHALLVKSQELLERTGASKRMLVDDEGLISNMRAASYAQRALDAKLAPAEEAMALYQLALAQMSAREPALWQLESVYLERCVHLVPHSTQAKACVERLADRLGFAFHGSKGGPMPVGYVQRLGELRALAAP